MKHMPRTVKWIALLLVLMLGCLLLMPWYQRYVEREQQETCRDLRLVVLSEIGGLSDAERKLAPADALAHYRIRMEEHLNTKLPKPAAADENGQYPGICRGGGTYSLLVDEEGHVVFRCDVHGDVRW